MADDNKGALIPSQRRELPASWDAPRPSLPTLLRSSGAWFGTRTRILRKDTEYVEQSTKNLTALAAQSAAMRSLIDNRVALARSMTDVAAIGEICAAHYLQGRRTRASQLLLLDIKCQTDETDARTLLAEAQKRLAAFDPPSTPAPARADGGLTPAQVDEIIATLPEVSEETRETLLQLLKGRLEEKAR